MKKGVSVTFDFKIADLKKYYSFTSPKNAYRKFGNYLVKNGFHKTKDSDYITYSKSKTETIELIKNFAKEYKWFTPSLKKLAIMPITEQWDLSYEYKNIYNDEKFMKQKEVEYNQKIKVRKNIIR